MARPQREAGRALAAMDLLSDLRVDFLRQTLLSAAVSLVVGTKPT